MNTETEIDRMKRIPKMCIRDSPYRHLVVAGRCRLRLRSKLLVSLAQSREATGSREYQDSSHRRLGFLAPCHDDGRLLGSESGQDPTDEVGSHGGSLQWR